MFTLFLAIAWGLGLLLYFGTIYVKTVVLLLLLVMLVWMFLINRARVLFLLVFLLIGFGWAWQDDIRTASKLAQLLPIQEKENVTVHFKGTIDSFPIVDGDRWRFFLRTEEVILNGDAHKMKERIWVNIRLTAAEEKDLVSTLLRGDRISLPLSLSLPNPPTNPGAFDFPQYLWQNYATFQGTSEGVSNVMYLGASNQFWWKSTTHTRNYLEGQLDHIFSPEIAALMKGMLLGDQREVSPELEAVYRDTGIIHILAISGTHVMLVIGALFLALHLFRVTRERTYEILFIFLPIYMLLTGLSPSVVRACLMGMIYVLAKRLQYRYSSWHAIAIVFILLTIINPRIFFGVGFQLSFTVTLGIILFTQGFAAKIRAKLPSLSEPVANAVSLTLIAQAFAFPILITSFYEFPLVSVMVNLLLMPIYSILIPWGYLALIIAMISTGVGKLIALPLDGILHMIHNLLERMLQIPQLIISIGVPAFWWWIIYFLLVLLFILPIAFEKPRLKSVIAAVLMLLLLTPLLLKATDSTIKITFIDVGQGDSIVIQGPRNQTILIDGGGAGYTFVQYEWQRKRDPFDVGKDVVVPALRGLGINQIDWLVISHGDSDHIGGLHHVVQQIKVNHVLVNGKAPTSALELELYDILRQREVPIYTAIRGPWLKWKEDVFWDILHPSSSINVNVESDNNASVVLLLTAYGRTFLFPGDIEAEGESKIIQQFPELDIDILKVAHHGSKTSTTDAFLHGINPEVAVISVGQNNFYGHPHPDVLQRIQEYKLHLFRTDIHGAITFTVARNGEVTYKLWKK